MVVLGNYDDRRIADCQRGDHEGALTIFRTLCVGGLGLLGMLLDAAEIRAKKCGAAVT